MHCYVNSLFSDCRHKKGVKNNSTPNIFLLPFFPCETLRTCLEAMSFRGHYPTLTTGEVTPLFPLQPHWGALIS